MHVREGCSSLCHSVYLLFCQSVVQHGILKMADFSHLKGYCLKINQSEVLIDQFYFFDFPHYKEEKARKSLHEQ